jgi:uncharacterized protein (DUF2141 family)
MTPLALLFAAYIPSTPSLGVAEGRCGINERGPAIVVTATGLRDRHGQLKLEVYPSNEADFLSDDNVLVMAGKTFRRAYLALPADGPVQLCIRLPRPGEYSLALLHDRNADHLFNLSSDGIGFSNNPRIGFSRPKAAATRVVAGAGITRISIVLNYRHGLFVRPLSR